MAERPKLLFIAPWFLFPTDAGGKIRSTDILRGMKGGAFDIELASPAPADHAGHAKALAAVADRFRPWPERHRGPLFPLARLRHLPGKLPINVATDKDPTAMTVIAEALAEAPDLVVVDFPHTAILLPDRLAAPSVLFTHNVEAEIFARHAEDAGDALRRAIYRDQWRKMTDFERQTLGRFDAVIAVSDRDGDVFREQYGCGRVRNIPTGVDLDRFTYRPTRPAAPGQPPRLVFTGSMNWQANIDAFVYFMDEIWPLIVAEAPDVRLDLVGREPPPSLIRRAEEKQLPWRFTGFVESIEPYVHDAQAYVIPLRVGGGTRIKVYEAMAMGCPVVSTSIGVEGLPIEDGGHYLEADNPAAFAEATLRLLRDAEFGRNLAERAHGHVRDHFSAERVARAFEEICLAALEGRLEAASAESRR